jgi:hypothetical protein
VAEDVVDIFEAVEVDVEDGERLGTSFGGGESVAQRINKAVAIGQGS